MRERTEGRGLATRAIHAGERPDPTTHAHRTPIYATATFTFDSAAEKEEARKHFVERYEQALQILDAAEFPPIPEATLDEMGSAIDNVTPAQIAAYIAAAPLAGQVQEFVRSIAMRAAEQRLLEHLTQQADSPYGGN